VCPWSMRAIPFEGTEAEGEMKCLASVLSAVLLAGWGFPQTRTNEISVRVSDGGSRFASGIDPDDLVLTVNGLRREITSVKRERRPLSIVIAVMTNPFEGCMTYEGIERYELSEAFTEIINKGDQVAIVVSDPSGTVVRKFSDTANGFYSEFVKAFKIADANKTPTFDELGISSAEPRYLYPLSALRTATSLLESTPKDNDRMILIMRSIRKPALGKAEESRTVFERLVRADISVSWLNNASGEASYTLKQIPYGKRKLFSGLTSFTGGYFEPCAEKLNLFSVLGGGGKRHDVKANFTTLIESIRDRYRLTYSYNDTSTHLIPVTLAAKRNAVGTVEFNYGKATTHD
jgi:hypothetical protein